MCVIYNFVVMANQENSRSLEDFLVDLNKAAIEPLLLEEVSDSLEVTSKKFEIMFDIKLYTSTETNSSIYIDEKAKPKITIDYFKDKDVKEYKSFNNLESLTDNFYKKIKDERNPPGKLQFLSVFRSNYKPVGGASTDSPTPAPTFYALNIQYKIAIKLQISKRKTIAQEYLLKIIQLETVVDASSTERKLDYVRSKKDNYTFELKDLKPDDQDKIKENIKKILESKKENEMINLNMESDSSNIPKLIGYLSENTYDISKQAEKTPEDENYSEWLDFSRLEQLKKSITPARSIGGSSIFNIGKKTSDTDKASTGVTNSSDIDLEIVKDYIYKLLGYEFLRIDRLLMIFNTDIFIKLFSILSNEKYVSKYTEILKFVYLRINIKNLEKIYEKPNKIYDIIDANTVQYDKLIAKIESNIKDDQTIVATKEGGSKEGGMEEIDGGSFFLEEKNDSSNVLPNMDPLRTVGTVPLTTTTTDSLTDPKYIFSYLLFKKLFNDFFGSETSNAKYSDGYTSINGMGYNDDNVKPLRIMLSIILKIEKNVLSILDIFRENLGILKNIDKDFIELSTLNKRVVSIVKRRHDYYEYDETHPLYKTQKSTYQNKLHYLDVYYINNPELKELFTYYDPYGRFRLTQNITEEDKSELNNFRVKFGFTSLGTTVTGEDKPTYFYKSQVVDTILGGSSDNLSSPIVQSPNLKQLDTSNYNEKYKFGPFDYLYNQDKVLNSKIARDIEPQLNGHLKDKSIMMNGFGQSGSGKTSTLIKLVSGSYTEDGVLIEYLKTLGGKISSIKIECVNLYYSDNKSNPISVYSTFKSEHYAIEVYGKAGNSSPPEDEITTIASKKVIDLTTNTERHDVSVISFTSLDDFNVRISSVGDEILKLFEKRQVLPTPNNDKSSRSHIIICLTLSADNSGGKSFITDTTFNGKQIIVCDLAGVENEFKCDIGEELLKFDSQYDQIYKKATESGSRDQQAISAFKQLQLDALNSDEDKDCVKKSINSLREIPEFSFIKGLTTFPKIIKALEDQIVIVEGIIANPSSASVGNASGTIDGTPAEEGSISTNTENKNKISTLINKFLAREIAFTTFSNRTTVEKPLPEQTTIINSINANTLKNDFNSINYENFNNFITVLNNSRTTTYSKFPSIMDVLNSNDNIQKVNEFISFINTAKGKYDEVNTLTATKSSLTTAITTLETDITRLEPIVTELKSSVQTLKVQQRRTKQDELTEKKSQLTEKKSQLTQKQTQLESTNTSIKTNKDLINTTKPKIIELVTDLKQKMLDYLTVIERIQNAESTARQTSETAAASRKETIRINTEKKEKYGLAIRCLTERYKKIEADCKKRLFEGFMINKSLAELSKGISTIVEETSSQGLPIYVDKQIDPKCRNNFLDYYTFDQFSKESTNIDGNNILGNYEKYGVILCILKYHYGINLNQLVFYNLLVYNTSFFSKSGKKYSKQGRGSTISETNLSENSGLFDVSYPKKFDFNIGQKNNPPDPPYVNINILKYFAKVHKNKGKLAEILSLFWSYVNKYEFYKKNQLPSGGTEFERAENWITIIERNNSATLIGTLETTDLLQTVAFKDVGCNISSESGDTDYGTMVQIFKTTTDTTVSNCQTALDGSIAKFFNQKNKDPKLENLKKYIEQTMFQKRVFDGKLKPTAAVGGGRTLRKHNTKRKTMKRKIVKTRRLYRKTKLRRTHKKY